MDRLDAMQVFTAIADAGSLSAASRRLGTPLATVSRKLADLEATLKTRLVVRSTRKMALTDAGQHYLAACRQILEQVEEAERAATGAYAKARGELTLSAPVVFGRLHVLPVVIDFLRKFDDVNVRLLLSDRVAHLLEEHIDVAVRVGVLPDSSLVAVQVGEIGRFACASPAYLRKWGTPRSPADLARHRCVTYESLDGARLWRFGQGEEASVRSRLSVSTAEAAIDATLAGVGITRALSYQVAEALRARKLVRVLKAHEPAPVPVSLVRAGQGQLPMKTRAFIDHAAPRLRERLAEAGMG